jgi:hypothetical protein
MLVSFSLRVREMEGKGERASTCVRDTMMKIPTSNGEVRGAVKIRITTERRVKRDDREVIMFAISEPLLFFFRLLLLFSYTYYGQGVLLLI